VRWGERANAVPTPEPVRVRTTAAARDLRQERVCHRCHILSRQLGIVCSTGSRRRRGHCLKACKTEHLAPRCWFEELRWQRKWQRGCVVRAPNSASGSTPEHGQDRLDAFDQICSGDRPGPLLEPRAGRRGTLHHGSVGQQLVDCPVSSPSSKSERERRVVPRADLGLKPERRFVQLSKTRSTLPRGCPSLRNRYDQRHSSATAGLRIPRSARQGSASRVPARQAETDRDPRSPKTAISLQNPDRPRQTETR